jgi:hypothetical protein
MCPWSHRARQNFRRGGHDEVRLVAGDAVAAVIDDQVPGIRAGVDEPRVPRGRDAS